ncbi:MAG TPA: hypothetical protein VGC88_12850 [Terriglobales bacterium]|jgi:hypothetical protein
MQKIIVGLLMVCLSAVGFAQSEAASKATPKTKPAASKTSSSWVGTWKLDPSKSEFKDKSMAPKSETIHITGTAPSMAYHISGTDPKGKPFTESYGGNKDQAAPMMRDGKKSGTATYSMPDENTVNGEGDMQGTKWTMNATLSDDKKTMTAKFHFTPQQGDAFDQTEVFNKAGGASASGTKTKKAPAGADKAQS